MKFALELRGRIRSLSRFPVPVATCAALAIFFNLQVAGFFAVSHKIETDIIYAALAAVWAGLAASLWCGTRRLGGGTGMLLPLATTGLAAWLLSSQAGIYDQSFVAMVGLTLAVMVAAHLRGSTSVDSFWEFDLQLGIAVAMGLVAAVVLCGGLSLLIVSFGYLFDVSIPDPLYSHIWTTGAALVAPVYALAMIPANVDEPFVAGVNPGLVEQSVFYVLNFALVPLVLVYCLMLHLYAVRLVFTMTMPKYETEWMVLTFGAVGTATYMIAYPWRELGYAPVRWFMRWWFLVMVVPTVMLALAVCHLTAAYGVTTGRYCLFVFAVWLAGMVAYLLLARERIDLRAIPASLSVALILSSFGPWGATAVSIRSQLRQFNDLLEKRHLLVDGRLKLDPPRLLTFGRIVASSHRLSLNLGYLDDLDSLDRIRPVFMDLADDPFAQHLDHDRLRVLLGMEGKDYLEDISKENVAESQPTSGIETDGSIALNYGTGRYNQLFGPIWLNREGFISPGSPEPRQKYPARIKGLAMAYNDPILTVCWGSGLHQYGYGGSDDKTINACTGSQVVNFNLRAEMNTNERGGRSPVLIAAQEGRDRAALIVVQPSDIRTGKRDTMFEVWILLNRAEASQHHG